MTLALTVSAAVLVYAIAGGISWRLLYRWIPYSERHHYDRTYDDMAFERFFATLIWPVSLAVGLGSSIPKLFSADARHQRKLDKKRKRIERMQELRALDEEYEREFDRLLEVGQ